MSHRPERIAMIVDKGCLRPADDLALGRLRARGYASGDHVFIVVHKPRNPRHHRLAHALGRMIADNIEDFRGLDAHSVLKRIQVESGVGCEPMSIRIQGRMIVVQIPQSMSFESMDQGRFSELYKGLCDHVATVYWPELDAEQIEEMAAMMPAT